MYRSPVRIGRSVPIHPVHADVQSVHHVDARRRRGVQQSRPGRRSLRSTRFIGLPIADRWTRTSDTLALRRW